MKIKGLVFFLFIFLVTYSPVLSQTWGISLNTPDSEDGYTFFSDEGKAYLIDNCGGLINTWTTGFTTNHPKILANGHLLFLVSDRVIEKDWDNNIVNSVAHGDNTLFLKYEVELLPNGNYLCVGRRSFSFSQFGDLGYSLLGVSPDRIDVVVELDRNTGEIIWEWKIIDHVIQERNSLEPNFGILSENPQLLNMDAVSKADWTQQESFMINGMDYNPALDQIILSVRKMSEIVIIDHSTTTAEAASHTGGRYGKGGDILYRWGNPQNYNRGTADDRILYFQHNPNWITKGELEGHIICYNNGFKRPGYFYSTVPIISPLMDSEENYILDDTLAYLPPIAPIEYSDVHTNTFFYSSYTSGAQYLENGNIFITEGVNGRLLEINSEGEKVWEYNTPNVSYLFRAERYKPDYSGFEGLDLTPDGNVPLDFSNYACTLYGLNPTNNIVENLEAFEFEFIWSDQSLSILNLEQKNYNISIFNMYGQSIHQQSESISLQLSLEFLSPGMYVAKLTDSQSNKSMVRKIIIQ